MKLYAVATPAQPASWFGTKSQVASHRKFLNSSGIARKDIETFEVEVPTKKDELVKFLDSLGLLADAIKGAQSE